MNDFGTPRDLHLRTTNMLEPRLGFTAAALVSLFLLVGSSLKAESAIGVNWGTLSFHKLNPSTVVDLLKANKIQKVKLFEADPDVLKALMGSGIQVVVGIPNEMLAALSSSTVASDSWVRQNVSKYLGKGGADIRYRLFLCFFLAKSLSSLVFLLLRFCHRGCLWLFRKGRKSKRRKD